MVSLYSVAQRTHCRAASFLLLVLLAISPCRIADDIFQHQLPFRKLRYKKRYRLFRSVTRAASNSAPAVLVLMVLHPTLVNGATVYSVDSLHIKKDAIETT